MLTIDNCPHLQKKPTILKVKMLSVVVPVLCLIVLCKWSLESNVNVFLIFSNEYDIDIKRLDLICDWHESFDLAKSLLVLDLMSLTSLGHGLKGLRFDLRLVLPDL